MRGNRKGVRAQETLRFELATVGDGNNGVRDDEGRKIASGGLFNICHLQNSSMPV